MKRVYIKTLGCKVNSFDSQALGESFLKNGATLVDRPEDADVAIVNSCSVTAAADRETRYLARHFRRQNENAMVVITGCYAQTDSAALHELPEVDLIVPNSVKQDIVSLVYDRLDGRETSSEKLPRGTSVVRANRQGHFKSSVTVFDKPHREQTRAFLKVQDGCNGFCSYCLIPYARGQSRSVPFADALGMAQTLVAEGVQEIVLAGIHIGDYGADLAPNCTLADLICAIVETTALPRLRISSLEPSEIDDTLIATLSKHRDRICDHWHLPLQSGSDRILKKMRRTYTTAEYANKVALLRSVFPTASIGADIIPGFPGETPEDHTATMTFIRELELSYLHVFPYSARPNTAAMHMPGHLPNETIRARAKELRELSQELAQTFGKAQVGRTVRTLIEGNRDSENRPIGLTTNYLKVAIAGFNAKPDSILDVVIKGYDFNKMMIGVPSAVV